MSVTAIDHLYVETSDWDASVAFWQEIGLSFAERWGSEGHRAGRLVGGTAVVVLAETEDDPESAVFFAVEGIDDVALGSAVDVIAPLHDTHWGTRLIRVRDPEGRVHALEETS